MANLSIVKVIEAGPGYTTVLASDGQTYRVSGDRNWRNNNPGNLEAGSFANANGAIGTDGRFAVFPDEATGTAAQAALQFESPRYSNLSIADAISRYAPEFENDSQRYAQVVAAAAGVPVTTKMGDLTPAQRQAFLAAQQKFEGLHPGRIAPVPATDVPYAGSLTAPVTPASNGNVAQLRADYANPSAPPPLPNPRPATGALQSALNRLDASKRASAMVGKGAIPSASGTAASPTPPTAATVTSPSVSANGAQLAAAAAANTNVPTAPAATTPAVPTPTPASTPAAHTVARVENVEPGFVLDQTSATRLISDLQRDYKLTAPQAQGLVANFSALSKGLTDKSDLSQISPNLNANSTYEQVYAALKPTLDKAFGGFMGTGLGGMGDLRKQKSTGDATSYVSNFLAANGVAIPDGSAAQYADQLANPQKYASDNNPLYVTLPEPRPTTPAAATNVTAIPVPMARQVGADARLDAIYANTPSLTPINPSTALSPVDRSGVLDPLNTNPLNTKKIISPVDNSPSLSPISTGASLSPLEPSTSITGKDITSPTMAAALPGFLKAGASLAQPAGASLQPITKTIMVPNPEYMGSAALGAPDLMSITPYLDANGNVVDPINGPSLSPAKSTAPRLIPKTISYAPPPPPTIEGSATGNKYVVGRNYVSAGRIYTATNDGGFQPIGKVDPSLSASQTYDMANYAGQQRAIQNASNPTQAANNAPGSVRDMYEQGFGQTNNAKSNDPAGWAQAQVDDLARSYHLVQGTQEYSDFIAANIGQFQ